MDQRTARLGSHAAAIVAVLAAAGCAASQSQAMRGSTPVRTLDLSTVEQQMIAAAVESIAVHWPDSTALCLTLMGGPEGSRAPSQALLGRLKTRQAPVRGADCPPTYTRMMLTVDSAGRPVDPPRPPGYIDPYVLHVGRPQFEQEGYAWLYVREWQGTRGHAYVCVAQSYRGVFASCRAVDSWIH